MKFIVIAVFVCIAATGVLTRLQAGAEVTADPKEGPRNKHVDFKASASSSTFKSGAHGEIVVFLTPHKGIHVKTIPSLDIVLDSSAVVDSIRAIRYAKAADPEYLNTAKPVSLPFTLRKNVKPGKHSVGGTVTYYFCSDAEGWCNRFKQPFQVEITVVK